MQQSILFIDDDSDFQYLLKRVSKKIPFIQKLYFLNNGQEGIYFLQKVLENKEPVPKYIFVDLNMPIMNGFEFIENYSLLKLNHPEKLNCSISVLSSSNEIADRNKILNMGAGIVQNIIAKPNSIESIETMMMDIIYKS